MIELASAALPVVYRSRSLHGAPDRNPGKAYTRLLFQRYIGEFQWSPRLVSGEGQDHLLRPIALLRVSMEPQIGIRGRIPCLIEIIRHTRVFQWSPRLVSGEGGIHLSIQHTLYNVSMEPQIGIRGRVDDLYLPSVPEKGFQWSPRLVSGEGSFVFSGLSGLNRFNGAPDWYPGKAKLSGNGRAWLANVSMEPQIGIRGRIFGRVVQSALGGVSMEPQIGIRGRMAKPHNLQSDRKMFQWSPRLVSGEGPSLHSRRYDADQVSMEPQIGIRGRQRLSKESRLEL